MNFTTTAIVTLIAVAKTAKTAILTAMLRIPLTWMTVNALKVSPFAPLLIYQPAAVLAVNVEVKSHLDVPRTSEALTSCQLLEGYITAKG